MRLFAILLFILPSFAGAGWAQSQTPPDTQTAPPSLMDQLRSAGPSVMVGLAWDGHYFEDSSKLPNYFAENSGNTELEDDGRMYLVLRLTSPEFYFNIDTSKYIVPTR